MNAIEKIRRNVFRANQADFAKAIGASQSSVHRWEKGTPIPIDSMAAIRDLAASLNIDWDDSWFFDAALIPEIDAAGASQ